MAYVYNDDRGIWEWVNDDQGYTDRTGEPDQIPDTRKLPNDPDPSPVAGPYDPGPVIPVTDPTTTTQNRPPKPEDPGDGRVWIWMGDHWGLTEFNTPIHGPSGQPQQGPGYDTSGFQWPRFNAPTYTPGPAFAAPTPFSYQPFAYEEFKGPAFADIYKDDSYTGRRDEGLQAIANSAAAKGLTRLPATVKALAGWNQDFAGREYGNIWNRAADTYDRNRGNAFGNWSANRANAADAYSTNYGISRDVWDRNELQNLNAFDRNYKGAYDMFDFNEWRPASMSFADLYNRWRDELNATTSLATAYPD